MSRCLKKSNFCFRATLRSNFWNSLLHFLYLDLAGLKVCRLFSSLLLVPGILGTAMSCVQGGIPVGVSICLWYCLSELFPDLKRAWLRTQIAGICPNFLGFSLQESLQARSQDFLKGGYVDV